MSDLPAARAAKERVAAALAGHPKVTGVGVARGAGGHVVKVLLTEPADDIPHDADGVRVVTEIVGRLTRRSL